LGVRNDDEPRRHGVVNGSSPQQVVYCFIITRRIDVLLVLTLNNNARTALPMGKQPVSAAIMCAGRPISQIPNSRHSLKDPSLKLTRVHAINFFRVGLIELRSCRRYIGQIFCKPRFVTLQIDRRYQHSHAKLALPLKHAVK
jgi:hypothetical protein